VLAKDAGEYHEHGQHGWFRQGADRNMTGSAAALSCKSVRKFNAQQTDGGAVGPRSIAITRLVVIDRQNAYVAAISDSETL
jgi:hypothetical protein